MQDQCRQCEAPLNGAMVRIQDINFCIPCALHAGLLNPAAMEPTVTCDVCHRDVGVSKVSAYIRDASGPSVEAPACSECVDRLYQFVDDTRTIANQEAESEAQLEAVMANRVAEVLAESVVPLPEHTEARISGFAEHTEARISGVVPVVEGSVQVYPSTWPPETDPEPTYADAVSPEQRAMMEKHGLSRTPEEEAALLEYRAGVEAEHRRHTATPKEERQQNLLRAQIKALGLWQINEQGVMELNPEDVARVRRQLGIPEHIQA